MKIKYVIENDIATFDHYHVKKKSDNYFGVYDYGNTEITSGTSMWNDCKKAKLLEIGYQQAKELFELW